MAASGNGLLCVLVASERALLCWSTSFISDTERDGTSVASSDAMWFVSAASTAEGVASVSGMFLLTSEVLDIGDCELLVV